MQVLNNQREKSLWPRLLAIPLAGAVLFSMVSIFLAQSFLALTLVSWLIVLFKRELKFSVNRAVNFKDSQELLLFLVVPLTMGALAVRGGRAWISLALLASGLLSALYSIGYFILKAHPGEHIQGFMGHSMTQAGLLLLFLFLITVPFASPKKEAS